MRSWLLRCSRGFAGAQVVPRAAHALCLHTTYRCIFVRELFTPATLKCSNSDVAPFPARLLWQFSSKRPRHLVLCVREPLPPVAPLTAGDTCEDDRCAEAAEAPAAPTVSADDPPRTPEDFMYGRLFLRPYNVAQLLTVLQGWSDLPAVVNRPRSSLTLTAVPPPSTSATLGKSSNVDERPREVMLTACLTRKTVPAAFGGPGGAALAAAAAHSSTDADLKADEDYPDPVYVDRDVCTLSVALRDSNLVLLTAHLESVLSDLFAIEHCSREIARRKASNSQQNRVSQRPYAMRGSLERASTSQPQYLSHRYTPAARTRGSVMEHSYQSRAPQLGSRGGSRHSSFAAAAASPAASKVTEEGAAEAESKPFTETPAKAAPTMAAAEAEEDDYEEIERDVGEVEGGEDDDEAAAEKCAAATPSTLSVAPSGSGPSSTSYVNTHTRERGEMTMESADRYAEARFVRDGSVAVSEVQEVSRAGDFDVLRRTRQMQGSTETGDLRTTVHAMETIGAFRSSSGGVTGNFAYEHLTTTAEATSAEAAAAVAAATAIPLHCKTADDDCEETATIEATAANAQPRADADAEKTGGSGPHRHLKEGAANEAVTPTRKRQASGSGTASSKKKTAKKKSRKMPAKRKSAASASASVSASRGVMESADTMAF
ncbi:hypothetical protein LSCM1_03458 [Leishmania martiniquensis]|uniref:Uncharacterized protein n=1 Tax=Leishmania martiniquensis TaxID=1580590 RepID=A0A836HEF2_9TRYP|nr:hypothetical protein LSCM1_03458 [Leishmania martiniquensis]